MKNFRYTIYKIVHDNAFRQKLEHSLDGTLSEYDIMLSSVEKETIKQLLRQPRLEVQQAATSPANISDLFGIDWYLPSIALDTL